MQLEAERQSELARRALGEEVRDAGARLAVLGDGTREGTGVNM